MLSGWAITQQCNHGPIIVKIAMVLLFLVGCESATVPSGTVELTGVTRLRSGDRPVRDVDVVLVRVSNMGPTEILAHTVSDSAGWYRITYDAVDPMTCGQYFAAARRKLHLGDLQPNLSTRVPCSEGVHSADFLLSSTDTLR